MLDIIQFIEQVRKEFKIKETNLNNIASIDVNNKIIYINKKIKDIKIKSFIICHELAHYYLDYLYENERMEKRQPSREQSYEVLCDILASVYCIQKLSMKPSEIFNAFYILYPSKEARFRINILRNVLILTGRYKYVKKL